jgi:aryl carrier-like protein
LTPNGKIDRAALPAPEGERSLDHAYVAPVTSLERQVAAVWCELLRLDQVGVQDNFFDLGGHSLLLIQLHARLAQVVDADLTVLDLFRFPTISALAAHLSAPAATAPFAAVQRRAERQRAVVQARRRQAAQARDARETE